MTTPFPFVAGAVLTAAELNAITTLPINDQTASYTLVVGDVGKRVIMNVGSANTVTVDDSIFATGDTIFIANKGAGTSTITAGAGVTINSASGLDLVTSQSGQLIALSASSFLFVASDVTAAPSGVVQVQSTTKSDTFTSASTTFVDVTGMSVSITPTSATNKVLVLVMLTGCNDIGTSAAQFKLLRGATDIAVGDAAGSRTPSTLEINVFASVMPSFSAIFLDSPASTSATTYKIQGQNTAAGTFFINRNETDNNGAATPRGISSITVMEVTP